MLLPEGIHPKHSIYYNGAFVLESLQEQRRMNIVDLYMASRERQEMSMPVFILCLDWLYLINLIILNDHGAVELCS